jgi:hypothetical protein
MDDELTLTLSELLFCQLNNLQPLLWANTSVNTTVDRGAGL